MAFQAYAESNNCTHETAQGAVIAFFQQFPKRRKCNIIEGKIDGSFFSVAYGPNNRPRSFKDVTKKMIDTLPTD